MSTQAAIQTSDYNKFVFLILILTALVHTKEIKYWVRPDTAPDCPDNIPQHQCVTVTDLVTSSTNSSLNQGSNVTIYFLPGVHTPRVEGRVVISGENENAIEVSVAVALEGEVNKSIIHCLQKKIIFVFIDISSLEMKSIKIENCGHKSIALQNYTSSVQIVIFLKKSATDIIIDRVTLSNSSGFGLLIYQVGENNTLFSQLTLTIVNSTIQYSDCCESGGGNILISTSFASLYTRLSSSTVSHSCSRCDEQVQTSESDYFFGGLSIYASESLITVEIQDSLFEKNMGGGIRVVSPQNSTLIVLIVRSKLVQNKVAGSGGGLYCSSAENEVDHDQTNFTLYIKDSTFFGNEASRAGGGICIEPFINKANLVQWVRIKSTSFEQNTAFHGGAVILKYDNSNTMHFILNCTFFNNSAETGAAIYLGANTAIATSRFTQHGFANMGCVVSIESTLILNNSQITDNECRALRISKSKLIIQGSVLIANNYAKESNGGGIFLECINWWVPPIQFSELILDTKSRLVLANNTADKRGGGIYIDYECSKSDQCLISITTSFEKEISLEDNTAREAGDAIFGGNFDEDKCSWELSYIDEEGYSSFPKFACICSPNNPCLEEHTDVMYPGGKLNIPVSCFGQFDLPSPCAIRAKSQTIGATIADKSKLQDHAGMRCKYLPLLIEISAFNVTKILVELESEPTFYIKYTPVKIWITIENCPLGFSPKFNSDYLSCNCTDLLEMEHIRCDINSLLLYKSEQMWVGNYSGEITAHQNCPRDYCKAKFTAVNPDDQQDQCAFNRSGVLCGACQPGLSLVLGTSLCKQCSNVYLLLLIPFALAGIVLVLFLLKCNLTVSTGTFNGLIFYANVVQATKTSFFPPKSTNTFLHILSVFIAWLNLDLGIETCFVEGLNTYYRTWLQFVFPVYIWSLAGLIILVSRYSITVSNWTGSNIVQVLATLFLLSYAKLLRVIIDIFSSTPIPNANGTTLIWLLDGNHEYLNGPHTLLFIVAVITLMVHILPFTILLLFAPSLQRYSHHKPLRWVNKLKPLLDAYQGPYENNIRYWTGLLLLVRLILLLAVTANISNNHTTTLFTLSTIIHLTAMYAWLKAEKLYTKKFPRQLEVFFMANILLFSLSSQYLAADKERFRFQDILVCCMVGSAFGVFIMILGYHSFLLCINTQNGKVVHQKIITLLTTKQRSKDQNENIIPLPGDDIIIPSSFQSTSCIELKEPLLEDT